MTTLSPLCTAWQQQVKEFFHGLHGHQSKTLALFVLGAIKAESIVISRVAKALLAESEAKAPSIERRLERFLSNAKCDFLHKLTTLRSISWQKASLRGGFLASVQH